MLRVCKHDSVLHVDMYVHMRRLKGHKTSSPDGTHITCDDGKIVSLELSSEDEEVSYWVCRGFPSYWIGREQLSYENTDEMVDYQKDDIINYAFEMAFYGVLKEKQNHVLIGSVGKHLFSGEFHVKSVCCLQISIW